MGKEIAYKTETFEGDENKIEYFFESVHPENKTKVIKVIEYSFIGEIFDGKRVFNLGFGDYDFEKNELIDDCLSNNGDTYKVFNTVLNTVPLFFENFPNCILFISGSDSKDEFTLECRKKCSKKCAINSCKNQHRRIKRYCDYITKKIGELSKIYKFKGGIVNKQMQVTSLIDFEKNHYYDIVLVFKK